jgi:uroporphyrinogen decarboxylase
MKRRTFLAAAAFSSLSRGASLTPRQRVDRVLAGHDADRIPFTLWHHFGLEKQGPRAHAEATLAFHRNYQTDLVKVMSDFPYPPGTGRRWWELAPVANPFAPQIEALRMIREGLDGKAHFIETLFNPWNVAEKLSSPAQVKRLMQEQPDQLLAALEVIAKSEANHVRLALQSGASGIFLAIANAQEGILTRDEYQRFSEPFDRIVLEAASGAALNVLHLHGPKVYLDHFWNRGSRAWTATAINYSVHETGVSLAEARKRYAGVLMGGVDQRSYRSRSVADLTADIRAARAAAGPRFLATPGCSVPDDSRPEELRRLRDALPA